MTTRWRITEIPASLWGRWRAVFWKRSIAGLPWFWPAQPHDQHAMIEARRIVRCHFGSDHHPVLRKLAQIVATLAWPVAVLLSLWKVRYWLKPEGMLPAFKLAPTALWAAMRHNILPSEYYAYGLWLPDRRRNIDKYLYFNEAPRLFKVLNRPPQIDPVNDKLAFHFMCEAHAIPNPAVLAAFAPADKLLDFESGLPPEHDLFVKTSTGRGHPERFRWCGDGFESNRGQRLKPTDIAGYLTDRARAEKRILLVQPVLSNHPDLRVEPNGALATARLVTGRSIDGEITPIFCFILFGLPKQITAHSNWVTLVDVMTGRLMPEPSRPDLDLSIYRYNHFDSNATLPNWDDALRYAKIAHQACSAFAFVGWDLAFTEHGVTILEGNADWNAGTYQTLHGESLGNTKFADILAERLTQIAKC